MQLRLVRPELVTPVPLSTSDYVPAVQNKSGELKALRSASGQTWDHMRPLVNLVGPVEGGVSAAKADKWLEAVAKAVGEHVVYLDVIRLNPSDLLGDRSGGMPLLPYVYAAARSEGICFVPVAWAGQSSRQHIAFVAEAARENRLGVALRFRFLSVVTLPGEGRSAMLKKLCSDLECDESCCDLILDLGYLNPHSDFDPRFIAESINEMTGLHRWRSVILLGSSTPTILGCIDEGTVGSLFRQEWDLWTELHSCNLSRLPTFGDYVIQNPLPPAGSARNMRANIRYTAASETLVARGKGAVNDSGTKQYRELCRQIIELDEFSGADYSDGDRMIHDCARGATDPGGQIMWRHAGSSHHLRFVVDQVRARQAASPRLVAERSALGGRGGG